MDASIIDYLEKTVRLMELEDQRERTPQSTEHLSYCRRLLVNMKAYEHWNSTQGKRCMVCGK